MTNKPLFLRLPDSGHHALQASSDSGPNGTPSSLMPAELCISSFAQACAARRAMRQRPASSSSSAPPNGELPLLLLNCRVLDPEAGEYLPGLQRVLIRGGVIAEVRPMGAAGQEQQEGEGVQEEQSTCMGSAAGAAVTAESADVVPPSAGSCSPDVVPAVVADCGGAVVMPGLCDAHVHCTAATADLAGLMSLPESYVAAKAAHILGGMLARGFTTVRDAGGADFGLAQAVEEGLVLGPRLLFTGHALSQTGGHGDFRGRGEDVCACGAALRGIGRVCDGDAEVRRAARDELRRGAHCIKIMASGGVASPTDRLTNTQFSEGEMRAIVEEAQAAGTYVCAHAYMPDAIRRAVACGVRSIEHGNYLDAGTAGLMAAKGTFLVPTLVTYQELARAGTAAGMPQELVGKVGNAVEAGLRSLAVAHTAGVTMCFGSDLLGDLHPAQASEFSLRARVLPAAEVLRAATVNCARLFGMEYSLGRVHPGFRADLLLLQPGVDPLSDVGVLAAAGGAAVAAVFKE
ncbi:hypothetical protein Agub_g9335, partial [Astrephomene gubernaculifera]